MFLPAAELSTSRALPHSFMQCTWDVSYGPHAVQMVGKES